MMINTTFFSILYLTHSVLCHNERNRSYPTPSVDSLSWVSYFFLSSARETLYPSSAPVYAVYLHIFPPILL